MADERDARLILRAEDRATKTFDAVAKSIANVRHELQDQAKAAEQGKGSLADLQASLKALQQAGDDLIRQQSAIKAFGKQADAAENTAKRVQAAQKAFEDYQGKLSGLDKVTDAQTGKLERLRAKVEALTGTYNRQTQRVEVARAKLDELGLSADRADEQFASIGASAKQVAQGIALASSAISSYETNVAKAATEATELAAKQEFLAKASAAGISADDVALVSSFTQANRELTDVLEANARSEATLAAAEKLRRDSLKAATRDVLEGNAALDAQFALLRQQDADDKAAGAFRRIASDAAAASGDLSRFGTTATAAEASITRFADSIRQTVAPTISEVQTLAGALKQVDASSAIAADAQKLRTSQYQDSLNALTQAQAALVRQARDIDAYRAQGQALKALEADLGEAAVKVDRLAAQLARVPDNANDVARELAAARRELETAGGAAQTAGTRYEQLGIALRRVGVDIDNLDGEMDRLAVGARKSAAAADILTTKVGGNGKGFLGLKSYELTNLGYQINDVFTSLASGIPITQTLAQQGPQIIQLFPGVLAGALRLLPVLAPLAAGIGLVAYNLFETKKAADAVRGFDALFTLSGNAAGLSAQQFGAAQIALEKLGASTDNAKAVLQTFIRDGLDPTALDAFVATANTIAQVTGVELPEAASKLGAAYSGGFKQISELNDLLGGPLKDNELETIERLFDAGRASDARTLAQTRFTEAAQRASDKSRTEWSVEAERLSTAFSNLNNTLRLSEVASVISQRAYGQLTGVLDKLRQGAELASSALDLLARGRANLAAAEKTRFGLTGDFKKELQANYVAAGLNPDGTAIVPKPPKPVRPAARTTNPNARTTGGQEVLRQQQTELKNAKLLTAEERLRTAEVDARNKAAAAGASDVEIKQAAVNARKIEQAKLDKEAESAAKRGATVANKAAREAESRQTKIQSLTEQLRASFLTFIPEGAEDPFAKIQANADKAINAIRVKFAELGKLGVTTVDGRTQGQFENQVRAYATIQRQQATLKKNEDDLNAALKVRKERLAEIEDAVQRGQLTPLQGIDAAKRVIDETTPAVRDLAQKALDFATNLYAAKPDPQLAAGIAEIRKALSSVSGDEVQRQLQDAGKRALKESEDQLDALVGQRDEFIRLQNQLNVAGLQTTNETQQKITEAYNSTSPAILAQAAAVQSVIDKLVALKALTPAEAENAKARVQVVVAQTRVLDAETTALRQAALNALSGSIEDFIGNIGTQIAKVIEGTSSLKDGLKGIAQAALQFAASFTQAIAKAIVQLVALRIAKAALSSVGLGAFHEGGVIGTDAPSFRRRVPSEVFAGAIRYHTGGLAGLRPDEVPAILQKGEEVITEDDPRHRFNGGATPSVAPVVVKNINLFDAGEALSQGANTREGEQAILNTIQRNATAIKGALA